MDFETVTINFSEKAQANMETKGIRDEDIREVLEYAETSGVKLYVEGEQHFLAKKKIGKFTVNVEYVLCENAVEVLDVYCYIITLVSTATE